MHVYPSSTEVSRRKTVAVLLVSGLFISAALSTLLHFSVRPSCPFSQPTNERSGINSFNLHQLQTNDTLLQEITSSTNFVYFPSADLMLAAVAKAGSTSLFHWLFLGIVGEEYSGERCRTHSQDVNSECWKGRARYLTNYTFQERRRILMSPSTLRMAVQRNPFDRLISCFNDKFACAKEELQSWQQKSYIVQYIRDLAGLPSPPVDCMNVSEFAQALDVIRVQRPIPLQQLDIHVRPQQLYFDYIPYDLILDVGQLSNVSLMQGVQGRLPFAELVEDGVPHRHAVRRAELMIPETAAKKLQRFAMESRMSEVRYLPPGQKNNGSVSLLDTNSDAQL